MNGRVLRGPGNVTRRACLVAVLVVVFAVPAAASADDFIWDGQAPVNTPTWSTPANWLGGSAPSGPIGTLTFPRLSDGPCIAPPFNSACYVSENDVAGQQVNTMQITGGVPPLAYGILGSTIALGGGGITINPPLGATAWTSTEIRAAISLSAPQTWSLNGGVGANAYQQLYLNGEVTGDQALAFSLNNGILDIGGDVDTGPASVTGTGSVQIGSALGPFYVGSVNGANGNPVSLGDGITLYDEVADRYNGGADTLGDLTTGDNTSIQVGQPEVSGSVTLGVNGGIHLSPTTQLSLLFNSRVTAKGPVDLNGATLKIEDGSILVDGVPTCNVLDRNTLVSTTGQITGTFQGLPDGTLMPVKCDGLTIEPLARIEYTAHTVTATLIQRTTTEVGASSLTPKVGEPVRYTATVTPEKDGGGVPGGTVEFLDGGQPIGSCSAQPMTLGPRSAGVATCDLEYQSPGAHTITATYAGASGYIGSASSPQAILVQNKAGATTRHRSKRRISLASATIATRPDGTAAVRLDCAAVRCKGTLTLTVPSADQKDARGPAGPLVIGSSHFSITSGNRKKATIQLNRAGLRLLRNHGGRLDAILGITGLPGTTHERVHLVRSSSG